MDFREDAEVPFMMKKLLMAIVVVRCVMPVPTFAQNPGQNGDLNAWKSAFMEFNKIGPEYFSNISVQNIWHADGRLIVDYRLKIDWAVVAEVRDTIFDEPRRVIDGGKPREVKSIMTRVDPAVRLKIKSQEEAAAILKKPYTGPDVVLWSSPTVVLTCRNELEYRHVASPCLRLTGAIKGAKNRCIHASVDLITGKASSFEGVCAMAKRG
jgi:hypothetical protein